MNKNLTESVFLLGFIFLLHYKENHIEYFHESEFKKSNRFYRS
jgi:hypothetical protein